MRDILNPREWFAVNHFLKEIQDPSSTVVSVYAPISEASSMINTLRETERDPKIEEVEAVIEKKLSTLKDGTICIFGWNNDVLPWLCTGIFDSGHSANSTFAEKPWVS